MSSSLWAILPFGRTEIVQSKSEQYQITSAALKQISIFFFLSHASLNIATCGPVQNCLERMGRGEDREKEKSS